MKQIKIGDKDKNYLEFRKNDSSDKIMITAVDDSGRETEFIISNEELEIVGKYFLYDTEEDRKTMENLNEEQQKQLEEIATVLGTTLEQLLESGKPAEEIIEQYNAGNFRLLNE